MDYRLQIDPLGDKALLVTLARKISEPVNELVLRACDAIEAARITGVEEAQPAYSSFCIHFDPTKVGPAWLEAFIKDFLAQPDLGRLSSEEAGLSSRSQTNFEQPELHPAMQTRAHESSRVVEIPVKYGGEEGPDLNWASDHLQMSPEEIVRRHAGGRYRVYMIGFAPGFPYLGGMDQSIAMPRLPTPRTAVPPGSVAIGGGQTGVYPWESPGGWRIIGRTPLKLFDPSLDEPSLLRPGDTVRFVPVDGMDDDVVVHEKSRAKEVVPRDEPSPCWKDAPAPAFGAFAQGSSDRTTVTCPSVPALLVEHPGLLSLVVDSGRRGYRKLGVPLSGAADPNSYALANVLCGNSPSAPVLEMTLWGAKLRALADIVVAITGAPTPVIVDGESIRMNEPILIREGSVLQVGSPPSGCRMYLAVSGGFSVPVVLGSASTYLRGSFGGFEGRRLVQGDILRAGPGIGMEQIRVARALHGKVEHAPGQMSQLFWQGLLDWPRRLKRFLEEEVPPIGIVPGPESSLTAGQSLLDALCSREYTVRSDSDRMGIRFDGPPLEQGRGNGDILSSPVVPGVIQVPSDGMPVLLLSDAQTCGGYRRVATVVSRDLPLAGQMRPEARVRFVHESN